MTHNPNAKFLAQLEADLRKPSQLVAAESISGEGRAASLKDEESVIAHLKSLGYTIVDHDEVFGKKKGQKINKKKARTVGDVLILNPETSDVLVFNIKTTGGSADNATSKLGFLVAFTDIPYLSFPNKIGWDRWYDLMVKYKAEVPGRDYYFMCFDKKDMSRVMIRGTREITAWGENPSNLLQIEWQKEWGLPASRQTFEQAYSRVLDGVRRSMIKDIKNKAALIAGFDQKNQTDLERILEDSYKYNH